MGLRFTGKDSDCNGYAAIAVAAGMGFGEALTLVRNIDRAGQCASGRELAARIHLEAAEIVAQRRSATPPK